MPEFRRRDHVCPNNEPEFSGQKLSFRSVSDAKPYPTKQRIFQPLKVRT